MRKFFPVSLGIFTGIAISIAIIALDMHKVAFGEEGDAGWRNNVIAAVDTWKFEDIFSDEPSDIYNLVYAKLNLQAENDALKAVAGQYGLTTDEARAVIDGSIAPIFNNPDIKGAKLTNKDAAVILTGLQEDFRFLSEVYHIQKEVEVAVKPSEIFANGDLSDSGFDLVHDLTVIEEILFLDTTKPSVGNPFEDVPDEPYNPALLTASIDTYKTTPATSTVSLALGGAGEAASGGEEDGAVLKIGDEEVDVEILSNDVCPADESLLDALNNYNDEEEDGEGEVADGPADDQGGGDGEDDAGGVEDDSGKDGTEGDSKKLKPAPADTWIQAWCQGLSGGDGADAAAQAGFGPGGMKSLGGVTNPVLSAGAEAGLESAAISTHVGICLETLFIKETVSSYQPGASCILCEIEKINEHMEETLSHTLIAGKATGNLFESAKCKETQAAGFDMQIVTIPNPIPTPPNDDLIYGKNIFEEWNKFVDRYKPIGYGKFPPPDAEIQEPETSEDYLSKSALKQASPDIGQSQILSRIRKNKAEKEAEALLEVKNYKTSQDSTNLLEYSRNVIGEMNVMNQFFESFRATLEKINKEPIKEIEKIPDK